MAPSILKQIAQHEKELVKFQLNAVMSVLLEKAFHYE